MTYIRTPGKIAVNSVDPDGNADIPLMVKGAGQVADGASGTLMGAGVVAAGAGPCSFACIYGGSALSLLGLSTFYAGAENFQRGAFANPYAGPQPFLLAKKF